MLFHSAQFGIFLILVLALSALLAGNRRLRHLMLLAVYAIKFQIYNDFSGYSDIAVGCGRLLAWHLSGPALESPPVPGPVSAE